MVLARRTSVLAGLLSAGIPLASVENVKFAAVLEHNNEKMVGRRSLADLVPAYHQFLLEQTKAWALQVRAACLFGTRAFRLFNWHAGLLLCPCVCS